MKIYFKLVFGTSLALLASAFILTPAKANPPQTQAQADTEMDAEMEMETEEVETEVETETTNVEGTTGTIKSIAGSIVTVELEDGTVEHIYVSQPDLGRWNLIEGMMVVVSEGKIVGISESKVAVEQSSSLSSRTAAIWQELEASEGAQTSVSTTEVETTQTETTTYEVPQPQPEAAPVRALW